VLKSAKITLMIPTDPYQIAHHQSSNPSICFLIIMINSRKRKYYSVFQGESDPQLYFSIGVMVLWQSTKKHQNCVGDDACRSLPIAHHQPSNPPTCLLIILNNSNIGVYYSVFQGESDYQLYFSIGALVLWQSAKNTQNCVQIPIPPDFLVVEQNIQFWRPKVRKSANFCTPYNLYTPYNPSTHENNSSHSLYFWHGI
jgi:hypothetical protein